MAEHPGQTGHTNQLIQSFAPPAQQGRNFDVFGDFQRGRTRNALLQAAPELAAGNLERVAQIASTTGNIELIQQIQGLVREGKTRELAMIKEKGAAMRDLGARADLLRQQDPQNFQRNLASLSQQFVSENPEFGFTGENVFATLQDPAQTAAALVSVREIEDIIDQETGGGRPAGQVEFESLIGGFTPADQALARRIKAGLEPRAGVKPGAKLSVIGGVLHSTDPDSGISRPVEIDGKTLTAEAVGASEAIIAEAEERGVKAGTLASKKIDEGFAAIEKINGNIRNIDRAVSALDRGARTGAVQRFFPNIRSASIELAQINKELGLDVIGSVTFGALSKGELDLALETALPTGLDEPELRDFLVRKRDAQNKLLDYYQNQIDFLDQGGTVPGFLRQQRDSNAISQLPEGTVDNGDGTFTLPDGNVVRQTGG